MCCHFQIRITLNVKNAYNNNNNNVFILLAPTAYFCNHSNTIACDNNLFNLLPDCVMQLIVFSMDFYSKCHYEGVCFCMLSHFYLSNFSRSRQLFSVKKF